MMSVQLRILVIGAVILAVSVWESQACVGVQTPSYTQSESYSCSGWWWRRRRTCYRTIVIPQVCCPCYCGPDCATEIHSEGEYFTDWLDRDQPSGVGDYELYSHFLTERGREALCGDAEPVCIECRVKGGDGSLYPNILNQQQMTCDLSGGYCRNSDNPGSYCLDYEVRFKCPGPSASYTAWLDRDNPSGKGDYELYSLFLTELGSAAVCGSRQAVATQCRVKGGDGSLYPIITNQQRITCDLRGGYCVNADNPGSYCLDYEVRFLCTDLCYFTNWLDRDNPGGKGDYEVYSNFLEELGSAVLCGDAEPIGIECRVKGGDGSLYPNIPNQQQMTCDLIGGYCVNADNPGSYCLDYEVRFKCPNEACQSGGAAQAVAASGGSAQSPRKDTEIP